ncbi:dienelactone hydrolase family protein [Flexibacterium corallicola]|uniref:dienelactone hydrolase family protein n=1 Tax=Flexibacterium corallicola TaxID=3037259 RepID=UPI00286EF6AE|nr:dienelactone hydrolase family protein [Pseudovibrio sp. M1P-2-3]
MKTAETIGRIEDFQSRDICLQEQVKRVYMAGTGPAVIVMPEMPGINPQLLRFARWLCEAGFTVYIPSLFGHDGATPNADEGAEVFKRACVSAEFRAFAGNCSSPVTQWLRALARFAHEECGGVGVGAIGMCFTGNFALSMMLDSSVLASVLSQPSLPLDKPEALESSPEELAAVRARLESEDLSVLAYRFEGDHFCQAQRFAAYAQALGDRFEGRTLPTSAAGKNVTPFFQAHVPTPHSVVTINLIDKEHEPTRKAVDEIIGFFRTKLSKSP